MTLEVLSPGTVILRVDKVKKVIARTEDGQIGIFPGHTLMLAETVDGPLTYEASAGVETVSLSGGILKVSGSSVVVFSGGFYDLLEGNRPELNIDEIEAESEFSRLATDLSYRLGIS